jgi:galactokinase
VAVTGDFGALFGRPAAVRADAPGRVNLIGEHTDYNGGLVLPIAIPQRTVVELAPSADATVRVASATVGETGEYEVGAEARRGGWLDYVQGVTAVLVAQGHLVGGFDARIASRVPIGAGVSSSAALEVALLRALRAAFALPLDDVALALAGQRAENEFVGARTGVMDQMAASLADTRAALFLDTRSLAVERVALPAGVELVVIDSGVSHGHAAGAYNRRREECERASALLGVALLRDVEASELAALAALPEPLGRRARHVVTENARVRGTVEALRSGDLAALGALLHASHESLRTDFEVSAPELDLLVSLAHGEAGVHGARLTGGGFGGAVLMLVEAGQGVALARRIASRYARASGRRPTLLVPEDVSRTA